MTIAIVSQQKKAKPKLTLAEIQAEAAKYGVKVIDGSARFKAIGIVGGVAPRQREIALQLVDLASGSE